MIASPDPTAEDVVFDTKKLLATGPVSPSNWGCPGYLTSAELDALIKFRKEVFSRTEEFQKAVFCFGSIEDEIYALCRWLRARKFDVSRVLQMVEEAVRVRATAFADDFYPDAKEALGVEPSVYINQYPQLYTGHAKIGCPLFISKPGVLNAEGLACITTSENLMRYHWHSQVHGFGAKLKERKESDPNFKRFECICIVDLEGLSVSNIGRRAMNIIKAQSVTDSLCFPETLNRFIIVNAPSTFSIIWNVVKGWVDPRTADKVEMYGSGRQRKRWEKRLLELVDPSQLPVDYGGEAENTNITLVKDTKEEGVLRQISEFISVKSTATSATYEISEGEVVELVVFTRSPVEALLTVIPLHNKSSNSTAPLVLKVKHISTTTPGSFSDEQKEEEPTRAKFPHPITGPSKFKVKVEAKSSSGAFITAAEHFLLVGKVLDKPGFVKKFPQSPRRKSLMMRRIGSTKSSTLTTLAMTTTSPPNSEKTSRRIAPNSNKSTLLTSPRGETPLSRGIFRSRSRTASKDCVDSTGTHRTSSTFEQVQEDVLFEDQKQQTPTVSTLHHRHRHSREEDRIEDETNLLIASTTADGMASYSLQRNRIHSEFAVVKTLSTKNNESLQNSSSVSQVFLICLLVIGLILLHDVWLVWLVSKHFVPTGSSDKC